MENSAINHEEDLVLAIKNHSNDEAIAIIDDIEPRDWIDESGKTLLHHAALHNNSVIAEYLIGKNCKVDKKDNVGNTPLIEALHAESKSTIEILLKANAKVDNFDSDKDKSIFKLLNYHVLIDRKLLKMLLSNVVRDSHDNNEKAQKLLDSRCPFPAVIFLEDTQLTKAMLARGCKINERLPRLQETALHLAVHFLDIENVKILLNHGADIDANDMYHQPPILYFEFGPDDADMKLHIFKLLLDRGASLTTNDEIFKFSTVGELLYTGNELIVRELLPRIDLFKICGVENDKLIYWLAQNENPGVFEIFQELYFNNNVSDYDKWRFLRSSASRSEPKKVRFFLDNGADINFNTLEFGIKMDIEDFLKRPMYSMLTGKVINLLLQYGFDVQPILSDRENVRYHSVDQFRYVEPLLAHLAMIISFGVPVIENVYENIKSVRKFTEYFVLCQKQIEHMKSINVYESITLHDLLRIDEKKANKYARNQDFVSNYQVCMKNQSLNLCSYYLSTLKLRIDEIISLEQLKAKVASGCSDYL